RGDLFSTDGCTSQPMEDGMKRWTGEVRAATADDLASVRALLVEAALPPEGLEEHFPAGYAVAVSAGRVVGVCGVEIRGVAGLLRSVAVATHLRNGGVGEALVRDRIAWAQGRSLSALWLLTISAARWFERFGFRTASRTEAPREIRESTQFASA